LFKWGLLTATFCNFEKWDVQLCVVIRGWGWCAISAVVQQVGHYCTCCESDEETVEAVAQAFVGVGQLPNTRDAYEWV
jgi:hypothetical protein